MPIPEKPITSTEHFLAKMAGQDVSVPKAITREDRYLEAIMEGGGGGGGGTTNYNNLNNKPKINGVTLYGDKAATDLGLVAASDIQEYTLDWDGVTQELILDDGVHPPQRLKLDGISGGSADLTAALKASKAVGGIAVGKNYPQGTSIETVLRDMLNPVENPRFTPPSATIATTGGTLVEEGTTANKTLTITFNRGSINPAYGTSGYRSGTATGYSLNGGIQQAGNVFNVVVGTGNTTFSARVDYAAGEQPKNSAGENYDEPLAAGYVNTDTLSFEIVAALWSNAANITAVAKEQLISRSVKQKQFNFPAQTAANPQIFDVPASWTVTAVEMLNTLNNQWVNAIGDFDVTDETHGTIAYKRYQYNRQVATGARSIRIKWN